MAELVGLPNGGEVWQVDGQSWLIYDVPNTEPPVPMAWRIPDQQTLESYFDGPITYSRMMSGEQFQQTGRAVMGTSTEVRTQETHPFEAFASQLETEAKVAPWLLEPDGLAVAYGAMLENRQPTQAEIASTDWWRRHTDQERKWMQTYHGDPSTAQRMLEDNRLKVRDLLAKAGVSGAPETLVSTMADAWTRGEWSQDYLREQARLLGDRYTIGAVDSQVKQALEGVEIETNRDRDQKVRDLVTTWLGPAYAAGWTDQHVAQWGAQLRNDPNAEQRLKDMLSKQRRALFPEHEDPTLTYEDIAAPWRSFAQNRWGRIPDETDPFFQKLVRLNDAEQAADLLRREGVKRGVGKVVDDGLKGSQQALGNRVQQSLV